MCGLCALWSSCCSSSGGVAVPTADACGALKAARVGGRPGVAGRAPLPCARAHAPCILGSQLVSCQIYIHVAWGFERFGIAVVWQIVFGACHEDGLASLVRWVCTGMRPCCSRQPAVHVSCRLLCLGHLAWQRWCGELLQQLVCIQGSEKKQCRGG